MSDHTQCPECGHAGLEPNKTVEDNEVVKEGLYCPDCSTTFGDAVTVQWDDIDFPVWTQVEVRLDDWQLFRDLRYETNLYDGEYNGAPMLRDLKCNVFFVWFKVEEDGSVEGPFGEKRGELL